MKTTFFTLVLAGIIFLSFPASFVSAQGSGSPLAGSGNPVVTTVKLTNPFNACGTDNCGVVDFFNLIINNILLPIGGVLAVGAFIWAGFKYVLAQGNMTEIKKAHDLMKFAVIGTALIFGAWAVKDVIEGTINQLAK
jgi:hypothetical protein